MTNPSGGTIYALSSGAPPAAIAVVRVSGPEALAAVQRLTGNLPEPRRATVAVVRHPETNQVIDNTLLITLPGPGSATGEDIAEFHLHGGRAVVAALLGALATMPGLRAAEPGEFTRRAFENGRMDLTEVEGLSDLLAAETESQRRAALALAGGALSRQVVVWQKQLLGLAAQLEAVLDLSDEADVGDTLPPNWSTGLAVLQADMGGHLARPPAERLREGIRTVIAGPPNVGKSSLLNILCGRDAAITSPEAGTTRDLVEAPTALAGIPFLLTDTAGLRDGSNPIEAIGVERARARVEGADFLLWLGDPADCPDPGRAVRIQSKADLVPAKQRRSDVDLHVSAVSGEGIADLIALMVERSRTLLPQEGETSLNRRQRDAIADCLSWLTEAGESDDVVIAAEAVRQARVALDRLTGRAGVEDMLDALFGSFCVGK